MCWKCWNLMTDRSVALLQSVLQYSICKSKRFDENQSFFHSSDNENLFLSKRYHLVKIQEMRIIKNFIRRTRQTRRQCR